MLRIKSVLATFMATAFLLAITSTAQAEQKGCSAATLKGAYAALLTGTVNGVPFAALDQIISDGNGNITGSGTIVDNGVVIPTTFTATYTITSNCVGTFSSSTGTMENLVILRDGSEVRFILTSTPLGPATVTGVARKLSD